MRVLQCTRLVNDIVGALHGRERGFPRLCGMLGTVSENKEIVKEIEAVFDPKGGVRSQASADLGASASTYRRHGDKSTACLTKPCVVCQARLAWPIPQKAT